MNARCHVRSPTPRFQATYTLPHMTHEYLDRTEDLSDKRNSLTLRFSPEGYLALAMALVPETIASASEGLSLLATNTVDPGSDRGGYVNCFPIEQVFITAASRDALLDIGVVPHPGDLPE